MPAARFRQSRRIRKRHFGGDRQSQGSNHRVAGSGHIEYLPRLGRDELSVAVLAHQTHAGRPRVNQQPGKIEPADGSLQAAARCSLVSNEDPSNTSISRLFGVMQVARGSVPNLFLWVHKNRNPSLLPKVITAWVKRRIEQPLSI